MEHVVILPDRERVTEALEAVVRHNEDRVYTREHRPKTTHFMCSYRPSDANPHGCIIGATLRFLGVPDVILQKFDDAWKEGSGVVSLWNNGLLQTDDEDLVIALSNAQHRQDEGKTWGDALRVYHEII